MKILIVYSSQTGNTKRAAEHLAKHLNKSHSVQLKPIENYTAIEEKDALLLGFWVDQALPDRKSQKLLRSLDQGVIGLFGTIGAPPNSFHGKKTIENTRELVDPNCHLLGIHLCHGKVDPLLLKKLEKVPPQFLDSRILKQMLDSGHASREATMEELDHVNFLFREALKEWDVK